MQLLNFNTLRTEGRRLRVRLRHAQRHWPRHLLRWFLWGEKSAAGKELGSDLDDEERSSAGRNREGEPREGSGRGGG